MQDAYHPTETTRLADVVLPAAQWGEKEWTSTNSERMVTRSPEDVGPARRGPARLADPLRGSPGTWGSPTRSTTTARSQVWDEFIRLTARPAVRHGRDHERAG